jgi:uncharacterized protein YfaP (DUF2135 family)
MCSSRRLSLVTSIALLFVLLLPAAPNLAHAEPPVAAGAVFDPASGIPRAQWEVLVDPDGAGPYLLWWDGQANQARLAFPCAVGPDGQLVLEYVLYDFGPQQADGENAGGGPRRPAARSPEYELPTRVLGSLQGWSTVIAGRMVLDPLRTQPGSFYGSQVRTHQPSGGNAWAPLYPEGAVPAAAWIDEGFENSSSFDPFTALKPIADSCLVDPLPGVPGAEPTETVPAGSATVTGLVRNATTGQPLSGAVVSGGGRTTVAGSDGSFTLTGLPFGVVMITATLPGFIPDIANVSLTPDGSANQTFALSSALTSGQQLRVVLTWGDIPRDLDAHLWVPDGRGSTVEVFYANPGSLQEAPFAALDVDDRNGLGPETITIGALPAGRCIYAVNNYSGDAPISTSGARVQLIRGSEVIQSFTPPAGGAEWWHVFTFDCATGEITPVNQPSTQPPDITQPGQPTPTRVATSVPATVPAIATTASVAVPTPTATTTTSSTNLGVAGLVRNAVTGQAVSGATVSAGGLTTTTDSAGRYQLLGLNPGAVQVSASAPGFITDTATVTIPSSGTANQTFALSQALAAGQLRIVLTWGSSPRDLDAHLFVPAAAGATEIYYGARGNATAAPFAVLDVDDRDGLGPETITISRLSPGVSTYSVHNYSGESPISTSGARVQVIQGNSVVQNFTVPAGSGTWWNVFTIDGATGVITPINRLSNTGR